MGYLPDWLPPDQARSFVIEVSSDGPHAAGDIEFQLCSAATDGQVKVRQDGRELSAEQVKVMAARMPGRRLRWRSLPEGFEFFREDIRCVWDQPTTGDAALKTARKPKGLLSPSTKSLGTRERETLLKIIIGMAMQGYTYKPNEPRNKATQEIVDDLAGLGIDISVDTLLEKLKQGAQLLPREGNSTSEK